MMASVFDVAKYILYEQGPMSTWKLQKLCYYAQAWTLAWEERPLFDEDFQAWRNGPVCPALFEYHKGMFTISFDDLPVGDINALSTDDIENITAVLAHYGDKEPYWLREQSHSEDPWKNARKNLPDDASSSIVIPKEAMGAYYGSL